uniref:Peptidase M14 domain-containing protein n=1 Tax=Glossina pallidipes TaxID=7398 RepID=A0A1B0AK14_GLOPL
MRPSFSALLFIYIVLNVTLTSRCQAATVPHFHDKEDESFVANPFYHSNPELEDLFARFLKNYPNHAQVYTIGHSTEGRPLLVLKICQHARYTNLLTPSVKLVANMHGDEVVGRQMLIYFSQYLLMNYQTNLEISELINSTDIYIMPSMNPDGFQIAQEGNCESLPDYVGRNNAAGEDLNRDFPDRLDNEHHAQLRTEKRQPETAAVIDFTLSKPFILSANFHGGAVVAGYPYDNSIAHHECCEESVAPDDVVFKHLAHAYADNHPSMRLGNSCNETFPGGITNGAKWYELDGGMQDFNYVFANCFELTIELTCCKYPLAVTLPDEWASNKRSLMNFVKQAHIGIKGLVKDVNGYPIHDARIVVSGFEGKTVRTTQRGEFWRLLVPGIYDVQAMAFGFQNSEVQKVEVTNDNAAAQRVDFTLSPISNNIDGNFRKVIVERADKAEDVEKNGGFLTLTEFVHHNYAAMKKFLHDIADNYPSITRLYSIGKSVQNRDLLVMELFAKPGEHLPNVPEFKYVANMHGNEVVGKEMLLLLTKYICESYMYDDRITKLVNNTRMHFLYSMNPDGYEIAREDDNTNAIGRENANNVDLNRNFPDQYGTDRNNRVTEPEVKAVMNWTLSIPFVLSANLHGGSLVANYPFDDNANDFNDPFARLRDAKVSRKLNPTDDHELFKHLAKVYSKAHPTMHFGSPCPKFKQEIFPDGIVNGAQWYSVTGGMQDWNYVRAGVMEITLELGCVKYPKASELLKYWKDNREPLLLFIEQVHNGLHGFVRSSIGNPVPQAAITMDGSRHTVYSDTYGDYWRLALPGRHNLTILADGFSPERETIEISAEKRSLRLDITLMRDDDQHWASANDYRIIENVVHTRYHTNPEIRERLAEFETHNDNGQIATFGYAENEFGLYYNSIKLTSDIGAPEENKFKILILSSFSDTTSPLGREISLNLVHELGERLLSPESEKRRDLLLQFLDNERFDLMLTFIAGHSELIYPKDEQIFERFAHYIDDVEFSFSPLQCPVSSTRTVHRDITERLTNLLYKTYNIPMFSLGLSCCRMPPQPQIASIWRKNIDKLKNFLHLIETGAKGYVQDEKGSPLREAFIRLIDHKPVYNVTKNLARFQLMLPIGLYALEISAPKYQSYVAKVEVIQGKISDLGVIKLSAYTLITGHSEIVPLGRDRHPATALTGFVLDLSNHPVPHAKISVIAPITKHYLRNFTDSIGAYTINNIPNGDITLKVEAPRYLEATRLVHVTDDGMPIKGVVFRLKRNEHVMGMPRFIFIVFASIAIIIVVVMCILCAQFFLARRHRTDKPYYNFSLLPQKGKELFEDDDLGDDGETELFRSPIKKGMIIKPYFDDDDDDLKHIMHSDNDGDDSDDYSDVTDKHAIMDNQIKAKHVYNDDSGEEVIIYLYEYLKNNGNINSNEKSCSIFVKNLLKIQNLLKLKQYIRNNSF